MTETRRKSVVPVRLQASHPSLREALISSEQIETKCLDKWPGRDSIEEMHRSVDGANDDRSVDGANSAYSQETENEAIPCGQPSPPRVDVHTEQTPPTQRDSEASTTQDNSQAQDGAVPTRKRTFEELYQDSLCKMNCAMNNEMKKHQAAVAELQKAAYQELREANSRLRRTNSQLRAWKAATEAQKRETEAQNARLLQENRALKEKMQTAAHFAQLQEAALRQD